MSLAIIGVVFATVLVIIFDVYLYVFKGSDETISVKLHKAASEYPIVSFLFGVICGHIFW